MFLLLFIIIINLYFYWQWHYSSVILFSWAEMSSVDDLFFVIVVIHCEKVYYSAGLWLGKMEQLLYVLRIYDPLLPFSIVSAGKHLNNNKILVFNQYCFSSRSFTLFSMCLSLRTQTYIEEWQNFINAYVRNWMV